jgi:hypothetical protein
MLPAPKKIRSWISKETCFKPLAQFLMAPKLQRIVALNKGGSLWHDKKEKMLGQARTLPA